MVLLIPVFSQTTTWKLLSDTNEDRDAVDIIESESGNIYITGFSRDPETWHYKGLINKINPFGEITDSTFIINHDSSVIIGCILPDTSIGYIIAVKTSNTLHNANECGFYLKRMDTCLTITSSSKHFRFPDEYKDIEVKIQTGINNNILAFGYIFPNTSPRMFIYETNLNFDSLNAKIYLNDGVILPMKLKQLNNFNYWIIRELKSHYLLLDSSLNIISKEPGRIPHFMNGSYGVKWDSDTSFYLAADYLFHQRTTDHDIGFLHQFHPFDTTGYYFNTWGTLDTNDYPGFWGALDYKNKDSIFIGGTKNINVFNLNFSPTPSWFVLLQTDSMLNIRWERFYGGDAYYNMTKLIATNDGGCIMAGTRFDFKAHPWVHERDIYILKVNAEGLITSANGQIAPTVHDAIVYPNPGSNHLKIRVGVQHKQSTFKLFDMTGRQVLEKHIEGRKAEINTQFLKSGTYVYTLKNNSGLNETGKWVKQ